MKVWVLTVNLSGAPIPHQNLIALFKKKPSHSRLIAALDSVDKHWELPPLENVQHAVDSLYRFGGYPQNAAPEAVTYWLKQWEIGR